MTTFAYHGINTPKNSKRMKHWRPYLPDVQMRDYGWTIPPCSFGKAERVVERDVGKLKEGDWLVGYSHGALICHMLTRHPSCPPLSGVIIMQGALREDTMWPASLPVLCLHNHDDWTVIFGRVWGRLAHGGPTGWGSAGRNGFSRGQPLVTCYDTADRRWDVRAAGHHEILEKPAVDYWGERVARWIHTIQQVRSQQ